MLSLFLHGAILSPFAFLFGHRSKSADVDEKALALDDNTPSSPLTDVTPDCADNQVVVVALPPSIDYGQLDLGKLASRVLQLRNESSSTLHMSGFRICGLGRSSDRLLVRLTEPASDADCCDLADAADQSEAIWSWTLQSGASCFVRVDFHAVKPGELRCKLRLKTRPPTNESLFVPISAHVKNRSWDLMARDARHEPQMATSRTDCPNKKDMLDELAASGSAEKQNRRVARFPKPKQIIAHGEELPTKEKKMAIPAQVYDCIKQPESTVEKLPVLAEALSSVNYPSRMHALLCLERAAIDFELQRLMVFKAELTATGKDFRGNRIFSFKSPALADSMCSRSIDPGSIVQVRNCAHSASKTLFYEGLIEKIDGTTVFASFRPEFDPMSSDRFKISFTENHANVEKMYAATAYAGRFMRHFFLDVLFPRPALPSTDTDGQSPRTPQWCGGVRDLTMFNENLNLEQRRAVEFIKSARFRPAPYIIYGPPGTGKTVTVVESILQIHRDVPECKLLVCAPSNSACILLDRLLNEANPEGASVCRFISLAHARYCERSGSCASFGPVMTLEWAKSTEVKLRLTQANICIMTCAAAGFLFRLDEQSRSLFTHCFIDECGYATEPEALLPISMLLFPKIGLCAAGSEAPNLKSAMAGSGRQSTRYSMASSESKSPFNDALFNRFVPQIIIAGDPQQLGPVTHFCKRHDVELADSLSQSLLERLMRLPLYARDEDKYGDKFGGFNPMSMTMLTKNYRSRSEIVQLVANEFYLGELRSVYMIDAEDKALEFHKPVSFFAHAEPDWRDRHGSPSYCNEYEARHALKLCVKLLSRGFAPCDIGVITPYRKQVELLQQEMRIAAQKQPSLFSGGGRLLIGSVEEFQGQERLVILISTVRSKRAPAGFGASNEKNESRPPPTVVDELPLVGGRSIGQWLGETQCNLGKLDEWERRCMGFVADPRRFNVAVTRAQRKLIVLGNPFVLGQSPYWLKLIHLCHRQGTYAGKPSFDEVILLVDAMQTSFRLVREAKGNGEVRRRIGVGDV